MDASAMIMWDIILTLVLVPTAWYIKTLSAEVQRIQILLNMTREEYLKRSEHSEETDRILEHLRRLEDKVDRLADKLHTR